MTRPSHGPVPVDNGWRASCQLPPRACQWAGLIACDLVVWACLTRVVGFTGARHPSPAAATHSVGAGDGMPALLGFCPGMRRPSAPCGTPLTLGTIHWSFIGCSRTAEAALWQEQSKAVVLSGHSSHDCVSTRSPPTLLQTSELVCLWCVTTSLTIAVPHNCSCSNRNGKELVTRGSATRTYTP